MGAPHLDFEMWDHSSKARTASLKGTASAVPKIPPRESGFSRWGPSPA